MVCQGSIYTADKQVSAKAVKHDRSTRINANVCSIDNTHLGHDQKRINFSFWDVVTPDAADGASAEGLTLCSPRPRSQ